MGIYWGSDGIDSHTKNVLIFSFALPIQAMSRCYLSKLEVAGALQQCHLAPDVRRPQLFFSIGLIGVIYRTSLDGFSIELVRYLDGI